MHRHAVAAARRWRPGPIGAITWLAIRQWRAPDSSPTRACVTLAKLMPQAPASSCAATSCGDIVVLPCGASSTPWSRANCCIQRRLPASASRRITASGSGRSPRSRFHRCAAMASAAQRRAHGAGSPWCRGRRSAGRANLRLHGEVAPNKRVLAGPDPRANLDGSVPALAAMMLAAGNCDQQPTNTPGDLPHEAQPRSFGTDARQRLAGLPWRSAGPAQANRAALHHRRAAQGQPLGDADRTLREGRGRRKQGRN